MTEARTYPNILFITTDQQRKDTIGSYGNPLIRTPNLDRLARECIQFERAYCESPICTPSRITMITGKKSSHHGATHHNNSIRAGERTIAQVLGENGYRTHFIGKPHFKSQLHQGTEESIADWRAGLYEEWNGPYIGFETVEFILGHSNSLYGHYGKWLRTEHPDKYHHFKVENMRKLDVTCGQSVYENDIPEELFSSTYVGDRVVGFLESVKDTGRPFYCFASFPDPHWPVMPPAPFFHMYDDIKIPESTPYNGEAEKDNYPRVFKRVREGGRSGYDGGGHYMKNPGDAEAITRAYWGSVSLIDKNVGRMLDRLEELGLAENTIVVFTADHGEYMGAHGMMAKGGFLWEEYVNVPFLAKFPGQEPGRKTDALLSHVDIVPTLLDAAGIENHRISVDGVSQLGVIRGEAQHIRDCATVMHAGRDPKVNPDQHALITPDWKLVYHAGDPNGELYDLRNDPHELNNLYNRAEAADIQRELTFRLLQELVLQMDMQPVHIQAATDLYYGSHRMHYDMWKKEFDLLEQQTGKV